MDLESNLDLFNFNSTFSKHDWIESKSWKLNLQASLRRKIVNWNEHCPKSSRLIGLLKSQDKKKTKWKMKREVLNHITQVYKYVYLQLNTTKSFHTVVWTKYALSSSIAFECVYHSLVLIVILSIIKMVKEREMWLKFQLPE